MNVQESRNKARKHFFFCTLFFYKPMINTSGLDVYGSVHICLMRLYEHVHVLTHTLHVFVLTHTLTRIQGLHVCIDRCRQKENGAKAHHSLLR